MNSSILEYEYRIDRIDTFEEPMLEYFFQAEEYAGFQAKNERDDDQITELAQVPILVYNEKTSANSQAFWILAWSLLVATQQTTEMTCCTFIASTFDLSSATQFLLPLNSYYH